MSDVCVQFKEQEKKRAVSLQHRQDQKHWRQLDEQRQKNMTAVKELETMQVDTHVRTHTSVIELTPVIVITSFCFHSACKYSSLDRINCKCK